MAQPEHLPFPSIENFRKLEENALSAFPDGDVPPSLTFRGTVKLHGTHADLRRDPVTKEVIVQSRHRVVARGRDNAGCAAFFEARKEAVEALFSRLAERAGTDNLMIAGEFCGKGIQKNVALNKMPLFFAAFAVKDLDRDVWLDFPLFADVVAVPDSQIYSIALVPPVEFVIRMDNPEPTLVEIDKLTLEYDRQCPFAGALGVKGAGEGLVWTCVEYPNKPGLWFKTKGPSHETPIAAELANVAKPVDPRKAVIKEVVGPRLTEQRMEQGIDYLRQMGHDPGNIKSTVAFKNWVCHDVIKEEGDVFAVAGLSGRDVRLYAGEVACSWFKQRLPR